MYPVVDNSPEFQALLAGRDDVDLARVALEVAADACPGLDKLSTLKKLERLGDRVAERLPDEPESWLVLAAVNQVLFAEEGLRGNEEDYYDPRNSYLNLVLERRRGIPLTLAIIYQAVAKHAGLSLYGVNLPAHFVLRTTGEDETVFIDAFHGGRLLDRPGVQELVASVSGQPLTIVESQYAPCGPDVVVRRLLYNLKLVYLRQRRMASAIPVLKRLALLSRETPAELRDLGIACFYGERRRESVGYLEEYLRLAPYADDADEVRLLLRSAGN